MVEVARVGPRLVRVSLGGSQLEGFTSLGFDHVKVFIPTEGTSFDPALPTPAMRDYTPHHLDRDALSLQLDFVHHTEGPATRLAMQAKAGDRLMIGGLRGSFVVGTGYDLHLYAGDETALPAIRRRLLELPLSARAIVFAEVDGLEDQEPFFGPSTGFTEPALPAEGRRLCFRNSAASPLRATSSGDIAQASATFSIRHS